MTSSDSSDSMGGWIPPTPVQGNTISGFGDLYGEEEANGQTEAVMVSVRYVPGCDKSRSELILLE
jgi:hypothetical protein